MHFQTEYAVFSWGAVELPRPASKMLVESAKAKLALLKVFMACLLGSELSQNVASPQKGTRLCIILLFYDFVNSKYGL